MFLYIGLILYQIHSSAYFLFDANEKNKIPCEHFLIRPSVSVEVSGPIKIFPGKDF